MIDIPLIAGVTELTMQLRSLLAVLPVVFWWGAMCAGLIATISTWLVVRDVNQGRPKQDREGYLDWRFGKMERIFTAYELRFPSGRKVRWTKIAFVAGGWLLGGWLVLSVWTSTFRQG